MKKAMPFLYSGSSVVWQCVNKITHWLMVVIALANWIQNTSISNILKHKKAPREAVFVRGLTCFI